MRSLSINKNRYNRNGLKTGIWEGYWENGNLSHRGSYINGLMVGYWEYYWPDGELDFIKNYREGVEI